MILHGRKSPVTSYINRHLAEVVLAVLLALGTAMLTLSHRPATDKLEDLGRGAYATFQNALHDVGSFFGGSWNAIAAHATEPAHVRRRCTFTTRVA